MTLDENLAVLQAEVSQLKADRNSGALQNDVYEAIDDLCHLSRAAVSGDTRVNYAARAKGDLALFERLRDIVSAKGGEHRERYLSLLNCGEKLLRQIADIQSPPNGHLGLHRVIRNQFHFLLDEYGFIVTDEEPISMRLIRGDVVVELAWATQPFMSFSIRRGDLGEFWVSDLLYLYQDPRCQSVPESIHLNTEADVEDWFRFISDVLRSYGDEVLSDKPGAFDRLAEAQSQRDAEYIAKMNATHGAG
jgi:hypothetical protein